MEVLIQIQHISCANCQVRMDIVVLLQLLLAKIYTNFRHLQISQVHFISVQILRFEVEFSTVTKV